MIHTKHGAILFTSTCYPIKHECYTHGGEDESDGGNDA